MERKVLVILGPTCSGKTAVGIKLAKEINSEIISADSRQIYKYLNIGTAKPTTKELELVKHHFINYLDPNEDYNVSRFENDALSIINELHQKNIVPIVVGGSGLYIKALVDGIFNSVDTDEDYREKLLEERNEFGNDYILNKLKLVDPKTAGTLLPQNWKRTIRALEVFHLTGMPIWKFQEDYKRESNIGFLQFGLNWEREFLYKKIEQRVDEMINSGLVDEVESLINNGYSREINSLNTVGYKEIFEYLDGSITIDRAISLIKRNTRRYAKRQLTWFRRDERIKWYDLTSENNLEKISSKIISEIS